MGGTNRMINIVKATNTNQVGIIAELAREIWTQHYTPIIGASQVTYMVDNLQSFEKINSEIISNEMIYYLAFYGEAPAGYCAIRPEEDCIYLSKFYVKEEYRKNGIGRSMIQYFTDNINNKRYIFLNVNKNNLESIEAYKRIGFEIADTVVTDIGEGFVMDDYLMKLYL